MAMRISKCILGIVLAVSICIVVSCGYFTSGAWNDDPDNWERAFRSTKPPHVIVKHSQYARYAHWSYEYSYFFEIEANSSLVYQLLTENRLKKLVGQDAAAAKSSIIDPPVWFAPKELDAYEIWVFSEEQYSNFMVLIDESNGMLYVTDRCL